MGGIGSGLLSEPEEEKKQEDVLVNQKDLQSAFLKPLTTTKSPELMNIRSSINLGNWRPLRKCKDAEVLIELIFDYLRGLSQSLFENQQ